MRPTALSLLILALTAAPVHAQVYRWVDDRGVVNYAGKPPADGRQAVRLDARESRLSIIPIVPREARARGLAPMGLAPAPAGFPSAVDRLTISSVQGALESRERCFAERRVDCTSPTAATYDFGTAYSPSSPVTSALR